jgi:hypothetical protein
VIQANFRENLPSGSKYIRWDRQMDVKNLLQAYLSLIFETLTALNIKIMTPFSHKIMPSFGINGNYLQGVTCQKTRNFPILHKAKKTAEP